MPRLIGRVAIVSEAANGIGAQIVRNLLKDGVKIFLYWLFQHLMILDIDEGKDAKLENEMTITYGEGKEQFFKCHITNDEQLFHVFEKVNKEFGTVDLVVNNAGLVRENMDIYEKEIEINFVYFTNLSNLLNEIIIR